MSYKTPKKIAEFRRDRLKKIEQRKALVPDAVADWLQVAIAGATLVFAILTVNYWETRDAILNRISHFQTDLNEVNRLMGPILKSRRVIYDVSDLRNARDASPLWRILSRPEFNKVDRILEGLERQAQHIDAIARKHKLFDSLRKVRVEYENIMSCRQAGLFILSLQPQDEAWSKAAMSVLVAFDAYPAGVAAPRPYWSCKVDFDRLQDQIAWLEFRAEKHLSPKPWWSF